METQLLIDNESVTAENGATFERIAPASGKAVTRSAAAGVADSVKAVESAHRAFKAWSKTGPGERRALLLKAAEEIEARTGDFIAAVA